MSPSHGYHILEHGNIKTQKMSLAKTSWIFMKIGNYRNQKNSKIQLKLKILSCSKLKHEIFLQISLCKYKLTWKAISEMDVC